MRKRAKIRRFARRNPGVKHLSADGLHHIERSLEKQWKCYRKELRRCQRKFSEKSVHNSRVAARRLLATIELLEGFLDAKIVEAARCRIKEHLDIFDDLRDTQVQMIAMSGLEAAFPAARIFHEWLQKREGRFRKKTCKRVKRSKIKPLSKVIAACENSFEKELNKHSAAAAANLLLRTVSEAFLRTLQCRARIRSARPKTIHRTRIAFKRFRYMVELLAEHLGTDDKMLAEMQHYQTMMGDIQDAEVLLGSFDKFARKKNIRSESAIQLREELVRRREWLIKVYVDGAGQLKEFWPKGSNA